GKDNPTNHGRAIPDNPPARIPGVPPGAKRRVTGRIVHEGTIRQWHAVAHRRWIEDKGRRAVGGPADHGETAIASQRGPTEGTLPLWGNERHVARDKASPERADLIRAVHLLGSRQAQGPDKM